MDVSVSAATDGFREHQNDALFDDTTSSAPDFWMEITGFQPSVVPDVWLNAAASQPDATMVNAASQSQ